MNPYNQQLHLTQYGTKPPRVRAFQSDKPKQFKWLSWFWRLIQRSVAPRLSQQWNSVAYSLKGYAKFTLFPLHQFSQQLSIFYLIYILLATKMTHWLYRVYTDSLSMFLHVHAIMPFYCGYITDKKVFVFFSSTDYNFFPMYHTFLLSWFLYATDLSVCQWPRSIEIDQGHGNVWKISVRKTI